MLKKLGKIFLTRSTKPFIFHSEYDNSLNYLDLDNLGLYIHIPFCRSICDFCPYCKTVYSKEKSDIYIDYLLKEIELVSKQSSIKKEITTLYFGGGSPALIIDRLDEILYTISKYFYIKDGIGIELHPEDVTVECLKKLKSIGITKISIGVQSFQSKFQNMLGRKFVNLQSLSDSLSKVKFETVSMDFIFALPNQNYLDLKNDIDLAFDIGANHIALYPFIDFKFTKSPISTLNTKEKRNLYYSIIKHCIDNGFSQNSIWTFSKNNSLYSSMTRENYLGFGCSATTLLKEQFKINTFSIDDYINRIENKLLPTSLTTRFTKRQRMLYYLFWTAYSTKISEKDFKNFFNCSLKKYFGLEIRIAKLLKFIEEQDGIYILTPKGSFYFHYYENFYTLSYIDKMWGIMKNNPFPQKIEL